MELTDVFEARFDPAVFAEKILGLEVADFHREWLHALKERDRVVIEAPRGHGKTTMFGIAYPLWLVTFNRNKTILIISNTIEQSKQILKRLKFTMLSNPNLKDLIPQESSAVWTKTEIDTATNCTIIVRPNTQNIRGIHADYVICDEVSSFEDKDVFFSAISLTVVAKKGKIAAIGTPMSDRDLLADLMRNKEYWSKVYPAIQNEGTPQAKPLWESRFDLNTLAKIKREVGTIVFDREYMCKTVPVQTQLISYSMLEKCFLPREQLVSSGKEKGIYYIGGDLAISQQKSADYTVFTVVEQKDDMAIIREIQRFKGAHINDQKKVLRQMFKNFKPKRILLDQSTFGEAMVQELLLEGLPVQGVPFNASSRMQLLNNLVTLIEQERLKIPRSGKSGRTIQNTNLLIEELTVLGTGVTNTGQLTYKSYGRHPDISMSLALACKALQKFKSTSVMSVYNEEDEVEGDEGWAATEAGDEDDYLELI